MKFTLMPRSASQRRGGILAGLLVCLALVGVLGWLGWTFIFAKDGGVLASELITDQVIRGSFDHIVLEQGEIESSSNTEVICEVKSRAGGGVSILWVADEGTKVRKGDKLVELDSSQLETDVKEDKIKVTMASANVTTAVAKLEQAKIAREEYLEGIFKTEEKAIQSEMAIAEQELRKAKLAIESSQRLVAKGLVKSLQLEADKFAVLNAQNQLDGAKGRLKVLQNLTRKKMLVQYDSDIEAAAAQLSAYQSELFEVELQLAETQAQIKKCVMTAPASGVVVHANRFSSRGGNAEFVVEAGSTVRERQAIIRLPDPTQMQIKCNVNESRITLIKPGMPVKITVDAIPGMKLQGRVSKVNRYAEPGGFFSSSIKEYATTVSIIDPPESIRTGMTAEAQIFVEQLEDSLQIPIQGLYEHGGKLYSLVQTGRQAFSTRLVTVGATNDTMASIQDGLEEGETVILNLREHLTLMDLPEVAVEDNSDMRRIGAERKAEMDGEIVADGPSAGGLDSRPGGEGGRPEGGRPGRGGGRPGGGDRPDGADRPGGGRPGGAAMGGGAGGRPGGGPDGEGGPRGEGRRPDGGNRPGGDGGGPGDGASTGGASTGGASTGGAEATDKDGDGSVTKDKLTESIKKPKGANG